MVKIVSNDEMREKEKSENKESIDRVLLPFSDVANDLLTGKSSLDDVMNDSDKSTEGFLGETKGLKKEQVFIEDEDEEEVDIVLGPKIEQEKRKPLSKEELDVIVKNYEKEISELRKKQAEDSKYEEFKVEDSVEEVIYHEKPLIYKEAETSEEDTRVEESDLEEKIDMVEEQEQEQEVEEEMIIDADSTEELIEEVDEEIEPEGEKNDVVIDFELFKGDVKFRQTKKPSLLIESLKKESRKSEAFTTHVTTLYSGYKANIKGLNMSQKLNMAENENTIERTGIFYKTLYDCIVNINGESLSDYKAWLKSTSLRDLNILSSGLYKETVKDPSVYPCRCYKCGEHFEYRFDFDKSLKLENKDSSDLLTYNKINVVNDLNIKNSRMATDFRISSMIEGRRYVFVFSEPSLYTGLMIQSYILEGIRNDDKVDYNETIMELCSFLKEIYIMTDDNKKVFVKIASNEDSESIDRMLELFDIWSDEVFLFLLNAKDQIRDTLTYNYSIEGLQCTECGQKLDKFELNFEELLFFTVKRVSRKILKK